MRETGNALLLVRLLARAREKPRPRARCLREGGRYDDRMRVSTGPDGPRQPEFEWPEGICGKVVGSFAVRSGYGGDVPDPVDLLCTRPDTHDDEVHLTELTWMELRSPGGAG
jgi:hypothetical protein